MNTTLWWLESKILFRQKAVQLIFLLVVVLSVSSIFNGLLDIQQQQKAIEEARAIQVQDTVLTQKKLTYLANDAGYAGYYHFNLTYDAPSPLAFSALGQRDVVPYILRVRLLGIESQLYDSAIYNASLVSIGHFDWTFVISYLLPLLMIALFYDIFSSEKELNRLSLLRASGHQLRNLWFRRISLRWISIYLLSVTPFFIASLIYAVPILQMMNVLFATGLYSFFWLVVCILAARLSWSGLTKMILLVAIWMVVTLILPTLSYLWLNHHVKTPQGIEVTVEQRDVIHAGWDKPKEQTMQQFFQYHPEWKDTAPITTGFHWKWYYAFHQLGDQSVQQKARAYHDALIQRQRMTEHLGLVLPVVGFQNHMHALARTDLNAQLNYLQGIRNYHQQLRRFYYPYIFNEVSFMTQDFNRIPQWQSAEGKAVDNQTTP